MDATEYGHGIDELLERYCGSYDSADYVRLAMAAATEAGPEVAEGVRAWLHCPAAHTAILSPETVRAAITQHDAFLGLCDYGREIVPVLAAVPPEAGLLRLCLAALDQAGMSARAQDRVRVLLGVPA